MNLFRLFSISRMIFSTNIVEFFLAKVRRHKIQNEFLCVLVPLRELHLQKSV